jgi:hypothetical protein
MYFFDISNIEVEYRKEYNKVQELELKFTDGNGEHKYLLKQPRITSSKVLESKDNHWDTLRQNIAAEKDAESVYIWKRYEELSQPEKVSNYNFEIYQENDRITITSEEACDLQPMIEPLA